MQVCSNELSLIDLKVLDVIAISKHRLIVSSNQGKRVKPRKGSKFSSFQWYKDH